MSSTQQIMNNDQTNKCIEVHLQQTDKQIKTVI